MDHLEVLAEIAIALAGFSAIIVVFRRGSTTGSWEPEDVFRLRIMLQYSLSAAVFALLPAVGVEIGLHLSTVLRSLSLMLALLMLADIYIQLRAVRHLPPRSLNPVLATVFVVVGVAVVAALVSNAAGMGLASESGIYLAGVTWLVVSAGLMFFRLIMAPIEQR